jgi:hypothetical protein
VAAAVYLVIPAEPTPTVWLFEDKPLARGRLTEAVAALTAAEISPVVEAGRVGVPRDRLASALKELKKAGIELPTFDALRDQMLEGSFLDGPGRAQDRIDRGRERMLAAWIGTIRGVSKAEVLITPLEPRGLARAHAARAVVRLEADGPGPISYRAVREILGLLRGTFHYDLPEGAVGLHDRDHDYLLIGDSALERRALVHAHEEDLAAAVLAELDRDGIAGAHVSVRCEPAPAPTAGREEVAVNRPMDLGDDPPSPPDRAAVTVQVPRARRPAEPTVEAIELHVAAALSPGELGAVTVERVDAPPPAPLPPIPTHSPPRKARPWWTPAAVGGGVVAVASLVAAGRLLSQRRPSPGPPRARRRERFDREDAGPGPAERVRAFVRRNPDAAAGVLQRWIGQGGHAG